MSWSLTSFWWLKTCVLDWHPTSIKSIAESEHKQTKAQFTLNSPDAQADIIVVLVRTLFHPWEEFIYSCNWSVQRELAPDGTCFQRAHLSLRLQLHSSSALCGSVLSAGSTFYLAVVKWLLRVRVVYSYITTSRGRGRVSSRSFQNRLLLRSLKASIFLDILGCDLVICWALSQMLQEAAHHCDQQALALVGSDPPSHMVKIREEWIPQRTIRTA